MFDNKRFEECPREEATHVYFAGNAHLIAKQKQDVFWCKITTIGGVSIEFFGPHMFGSICYAICYPNNATEGAQAPVFIKEKELEVKFIAGGGYKSLVATCDGREVLAISLAKNCVHAADELLFEFDDDWTLRQIKEAAADYARKIARGEL